MFNESIKESESQLKAEIQEKLGEKKEAPETRFQNEIFHVLKNDFTVDSQRDILHGIKRGLIEAYEEERLCHLKQADILAEKISVLQS